MKRDIFQALADPTRRAILLLLASKAMTPNSLATHFDSTRQAVSKHLRVLTESNLVKPKKEGREIFYQVNPKKISEFDRWLDQFKRKLELQFNQLDSLLNQLKTEK